MKIKAKTKDQRLIVKVKFSSKEKFNEKLVEAFSRVYMRGFLKPTILKKNLIEYSGPIGISLSERLKTPISSYDFFFMVEQIVVSVEKLKRNKFSLNHIILDMQNSYINSVTKELQLIYLPMEARKDDVDFCEFIEKIIYSVIPASVKDADQISKFTYFFKSLKKFDIDAIEKYIEKTDRSIVNTIRKSNMGQSGFITNKQKVYYEHYDNNVDATAILEEDEKNGLLNKEDEATGLLTEEDEATGLLIDDTDDTGKLDDEETGLLVNDESVYSADSAETALLIENDVRYPSLLRILTDEVISINKPVFRIGKENSYVDYFVMNNNAVSRSHADIITRGINYFVVDLNSRNHTYINNQILLVKCETQIFDGDILKLANEEFIFRT